LDAPRSEMIGSCFARVHTPGIACPCICGSGTGRICGGKGREGRSVGGREGGRETVNEAQCRTTSH
jgi:hypothetical protein